MSPQPQTVTILESPQPQTAPPKCHPIPAGRSRASPWSHPASPCPAPAAPSQICAPPVCPAAPRGDPPACSCNPPAWPPKGDTGWHRRAGPQPQSPPPQPLPAPSPASPAAAARRRPAARPGWVCCPAMAAGRAECREAAGTAAPRPQQRSAAAAALLRSRPEGSWGGCGWGGGPHRRALLSLPWGERGDGGGWGRGGAGWAMGWGGWASGGADVGWALGGHLMGSGVTLTWHWVGAEMALIDSAGWALRLR